MLFNVVLIKDWEVKHRIIVEKKITDKNFLLPCGTVLDVYGIYGDTQGGYSGSGYTVSRFIVFHKSLPCFYDCDVSLCRPI